jgi:hypothetical protein
MKIPQANVVPDSTKEKKAEKRARSRRPGANGAK